jgi:hypothetical protein
MFQESSYCSHEIKGSRPASRRQLFFLLPEDPFHPAIIDSRTLEQIRQAVAAAAVAHPLINGVDALDQVGKLAAREFDW